MKNIQTLLVIVFSVLAVFAASCSKKNNIVTPAVTDTPVPVYSSTLTPTATIPDNSIYNFETPTDMGFNSFGQGVTGTANVTEKAFAGGRSLAMLVNFNGLQDGNAFTSTPLFTSVAGKLIIAKLWIPSNFPSGAGGSIVMKTGSSYTWQNTWVNFSAGAWNYLMIDPNNIMYSSDGVTPVATNQNDLRGIGVQVHVGSASTWKGVLYLDCIDLITAPPVATPTSNPPPTITPTPNSGYASDPYIQYYGRWDMSDPTNYRADWGNVYIKAKFTGTSVGVRMWDSGYQNRYQFSIDGGAFTDVYANTSTIYALASGLINTTHTVTFMRLTDCNLNSGITNFWGFTDAAGGGLTLVAPDPRPSRKMEFIGDSISVGTRDECTNNLGACANNTPQNENGYLAWGPQTAVALSAEYGNIGRGGLGVYHNWNESAPDAEQHAIDFFHQTLFNYALPAWNHSSWQPDAVVIGLGTNDCNSQWNFGPSSSTTTAFKAKYNELLDYLESVYPSAQIFCMEPIPEWCMQFDGACSYGTYNSWTGETYVKQVVDVRADSHVHYLRLNDSRADALIKSGDCAGDNTHPTAAGDLKIRDKIVPQIQSVMSW